MSKKYPLKKEFSVLKHWHTPMCKFLLPIVNGLLSVLCAQKSDRRTRVNKLKIPVSGNRYVSCFLVSPKTAEIDENLPCLFLIHGGGFALKAAPQHYALARDYAVGAHCRVAVVNYRLAPKHPFPVPLEDCMCAYKYILNNADGLGIDSDKIAVGGDSAGGCLAAAVCLSVRDANIKRPVMQFLIYPVTDMRQNTRSLKDFFDAPVWTAKANAKMWRWYCGSSSTNLPQYLISPAQVADCSGLPPAYIETAQYDCLNGDGQTYAEALTSGGVEVVFRETHGTVHGFEFCRRNKYVRGIISDRVEVLKHAFFGKE
ncbi:MAG: alpha/beta hydrolase [Corallococcus sp.]|nr:alpha/beta hydrolase [Corallococcus sp.]